MLTKKADNILRNCALQKMVSMVGLVALDVIDSRRRRHESVDKRIGSRQELGKIDLLDNLFRLGSYR